MELIRVLARSLKVVVGLLVFAFGSFLSIQANIGLAPWDALSMGISLRTGIPYGTTVVLVSMGVLVVSMLMRERVGIGTILNVLLFGTFVGMYQSLVPIPRAYSLFTGVAMLVCGQAIMSVGAYMYIHIGLGSGPRDALMIGLSRRFPRVPVGVIRGILEGSVLAVGAMLGGPIGIGTLIAAFGIGLFLQVVFAVTGFDVHALRHESLADTLRYLRGGERR